MRCLLLWTFVCFLLLSSAFGDSHLLSSNRINAKERRSKISSTLWRLWPLYDRMIWFEGDVILSQDKQPKRLCQAKAMNGCSKLNINRLKCQNSGRTEPLHLMLIINDREQEKILVLLESLQ